MNIGEKMKEMLVSNGMFDSQAEDVIDAAKADDMCETLNGIWNKDVGGYPPMLINVAWLSVKTVAAKWIDENAPDAWFKPMFAQDA